MGLDSLLSRNRCFAFPHQSALAFSHVIGLSVISLFIPLTIALPSSFCQGIFAICSEAFFPTDAQLEIFRTSKI